MAKPTHSQQPKRKFRHLLTTSIGIIVGIGLCALVAIAVFPETLRSFVGFQSYAQLCVRCGAQLRLRSLAFGEGHFAKRTTFLTPGLQVLNPERCAHYGRPLGAVETGFVPVPFRLIHRKTGFFDGDSFYTSSPVKDALNEIAMTNAYEVELTLEWLQRMRFAGKTNAFAAFNWGNAKVFKEQLQSEVDRHYRDALPPLRRTRSQP